MAGAVTVLALTVVMPAGALLVAAVLLAHAVVARRGHRREARAQAAWLGNQAAGRVVSQYGNRLNAAAMADIQKAFTHYLG